MMLLTVFLDVEFWCNKSAAAFGLLDVTFHISSNLFGCRYDGSGRMEKEIRTIYFFEFNSFSKILMK
ncbi:hypothetical protein RCL_jg9398.t1 [Rhizophagus clarus]|uniref:Uncharacterized protein n=1 Tax=Rhizophagus clarus TaxID=94130 RepID=A0A8H3R0L6_9GLOM|nr:hypothetical protein RCL_jg17682.t1 [Rhizophagus clarus]GES90365.1 hypothetical protein RCL_jg13472.t1 [Rhizophagus clarus]GES98422.1 hypothetical protein RCL_jg26682.t1 [Rhizophagus clarus]GES98938.1 hypothetical protein RCL_jg973.t1 [Rhizophagus clarus]GES99286.1 hypothetical protein RCL_jg9398.t1 [Rhizophagus clarus]